MLLFERRGSVIPMTGTKDESQNVFQDEIFLFQERKIYFGAEHWEWVGQSLNLPEAADRWDFLSQLFCPTSSLLWIWWKQNLAEVTRQDDHANRLNGPALFQHGRWTRGRNIFKVTINLSSQILADEENEVQQCSHFEDGLKPGQHKMPRPILNRCKCIWFILYRCIQILSIKSIRHATISVMQPNSSRTSEPRLVSIWAETSDHFVGAFIISNDY